MQLLSPKRSVLRSKGNSLLKKMQLSCKHTFESPTTKLGRSKFTVPRRQFTQGTDGTTVRTKLATVTKTRRDGNAMRDRKDRNRSR